MAEYTPDQESIVKKILAIEKSDYYKILHIEKSASEVEIKKSYRKLAIKLHPDKNKHPKSAEAFKKLAKAFEVLSDDDKKRIYDQTGYDPDERGAGGGTASGFSNFNGSGNPYARRNPFQAAAGGGPQAFDAEDLFSFMFGGGGPSAFNSFGDGNGFSFQFGGPSPGAGNPFFAFQQQQQQQRERQRQRQQEQRRAHPRTPVEQLKETARAILPFVLVFVLPMLFSFFAGDDSSSATGSRLPKYSFEVQPSLPIQRFTTKYRIPYYINEKTFTNNGGYQDPDSPKLKTLDKRVENQYVNDLKYRCHREHLQKQDAIEDSTFFFFVNEKKLAEANAMETPSCDRLSEMGLL